MNKILFFKLGALGDVLMTTPLVRAVREKYPNALIDYYVGNSYYDVIATNPDINNIETFDQSMFFKKDIFSVLKLFKEIKKKRYDTIFILDKHWIISLFAWFIRIPKRVGFNRDFKGIFNTINVDYKVLKHEIEFYLDMFFRLSKQHIAAERNMVFNISVSDKMYADEMFKIHKLKNNKTICVIPGGANNPGVGDDSIRRWPVSKYLDLISKILHKGYKVIILGGPGDVKINNIIMNGIYIEGTVINLTGKTLLSKSAALMEKCKYVICNDSGPMHLASAVNDNVISLFGPTHPLRKAPIGLGHRYIWTDEDVYDSKYELFGDKSNLQDEYMKDLTVKLVLEAIK